MLTSLQRCCPVVLVEDRVLDVEGLVVADRRRMEPREEPVHRHAEAVGDVPLIHGRHAAALLLLDARAEARAAQAQQRTLVLGDRPVFVGIELAGRIGVDAELVHGVRTDFGVLVHAGDHDAHAVFGERAVEHAAHLVAAVFGQVVVVAFGREREALAEAVERPRGAQVDRAADAAFEVGRLGGLQHVGPRDHLGRQHVEGELAAVAVGREDAAVQRHDAELGPEAAHVDELAFAAARTLDGDAGDVREGIGDVVVGEAAEVLGDDGVLDDLGAALAVERLDERRARAGDDDFTELRRGRRAGRGLRQCGRGHQGAETGAAAHQQDCQIESESICNTHGLFPLGCRAIGC